MPDNDPASDANHLPEPGNVVGRGGDATPGECPDCGGEGSTMEETGRYLPTGDAECEEVPCHCQATPGAGGAGDVGELERLAIEHGTLDVVLRPETVLALVARVRELERTAAWLIRGVQHVIESLDENVERFDEDGDGWEARLRSHCLGTLTADDGTPLPTKFEAALAAHDAEMEALAPNPKEPHA